MNIFRDGITKRSTEKNLPWRRSKKVGTTNNLVDASCCVIDNHSQLISKEPVGTTQDKITDRF